MSLIMKYTYGIFLITSGFLLYNSQGTSIADTLREKLLENYVKDEEPSESSVTIIFYLHSYQILEHSDRISSLLYVVSEWNDLRLAWNPLEYMNLSEISLNSKDVWTPELVPISNNIVPSMEFKLQSEKKHIHNIYVDYEGKIYLLYSTKYDTRCEIDIKYWPDDVHTCFIKYAIPPGSLYKIQELEMHYPYNKNRQDWILRIDLTYELSSPHFGRTIESKLIFKRRSSVYTGMFYIPSIIIMVIILVILRLSPQNPNRVTIFGVLITLQCGISQILRYQIPLSGYTTPLIVSYFHRIHGTTLVCTLETIFLKVLLSLNLCPLWLYSFNCYISKIKILQNFTSVNKNISKLEESDDDESAQQAAASLNESELEKSKLLERTIRFLDNFVFFATLVTILVIIFSYHF